LPSAAAGSTAAPAGSGAAAFGSSAAVLSQAHEALQRKDLRRAEQLYQSVVDKEPNNTEAIAGLAEVARQQGNLGRADALYKRSLEENDGYIPSITSGADLKWETGQKDAAVGLYQRLLELDPNGPAAERARSRIAQYNAENAKGATPGPDSTSGDGAASGGSEDASTSGGLPPDVPTSP
jgi:tetratricopeptide (TPR) repeat protein